MRRSFDLHIYLSFLFENQFQSVIETWALSVSHDASFVIIVIRGGSRDFKKVLLYVGDPGWPTKKILGFGWSKRPK